MSEPEQSVVKNCLRCNCIGIERDGQWLWMKRPKCFIPRPHVLMVNETCPACDVEKPKTP